MQPSPPLSPRKSPRQARSRATVDAILEACARVLVEEGYDRASTNRVAKVAGVSVGSLYQYFPSKEALVLALFERHSSRMLALLADSLRELGDAPIPEAVRTYVRAMMAAHRVEPELHRALVEQVLHLGLEHLSEVQRTARTLVRSYLERHQHEILTKDLDAAAFVLVAAVEAVTHGAMLEQTELFASAVLEDEVCALVLRYLLGESRPSSPVRPAEGARARRRRARAPSAR